MKIKEFNKKVVECYGKYFDGSLCDSKIYTCLGKSLYIQCYLANNEKECAFGYFDNDPLKIKFNINLSDDVTEESELNNNLILENYCKEFYTKPSESYLCYGHKSISFRKTTGDADKIIKSLDRFFKKLHDAIIEEYNKDNLKEEHKKLFEKRVKGIN